VVGTILAGNPPYTYPENLPKVGLPGVGPSCYEPRGGRVGHVDFPDGSDAYRPINDAGDLIGNPLATLLFGGH
ncbi:MAG: mammalian cell entry protein, partial [Gordonia polyisoprenivorans]|nr:mammalian cell entry protein [Gordonia polyisoprenivorans]